MSTENAEGVYFRLSRAFWGELYAIREGSFEGLSIDTVFALGEALGIVAKAKALVGRDIDEARREHGEAGSVGDDADRRHDADAPGAG